MCQISGFSHHFAGETVLHFRARGFPYEIDIKAHVGSLPVGVKAKRNSSLGELATRVSGGEIGESSKSDLVGENVKEFTQIQANLCL